MKFMNAGQVPREEATVTIREAIGLDEPAEAEILSREAFEARGRRYVLREPAVCYGTREDGYYVFECPQYRISGYAKRREEALADLSAEFAFLYDGLVGEAATALSLDARELRDLIQQGVLRVEAEQVGMSL